MKTILFVFCLFFFYNSSTIHAQTPGYVIAQNGDSLYGNISYRNYHFYIENSSGQTDSIPAAQTILIKNKKMQGKVYYGPIYQFDNDIDPVRDKKDDKSYDTALVLKTVYSNSIMTLFEGVDHYKRIYYFVEKKGDSLPTQMMVSYKIITVTNASVANLDANVKHIQIKTYINQLKSMMADCKNVDRYAWDEMDYRSYSFKSVIKWYAKCR